MLSKWFKNNPNERKNKMTNQKQQIHLSFILIGEALEKPNSKIILEERIPKLMIQETKKPTQEELYLMRKKVMKTVIQISCALYITRVNSFFYEPEHPENYIKYRNKSKILESDTI